VNIGGGGIESTTQPGTSTLNLESGTAQNGMFSSSTTTLVEWHNYWYPCRRTSPFRPCTLRGTIIRDAVEELAAMTNAVCNPPNPCTQTLSKPISFLEPTESQETKILVSISLAQFCSREKRKSLYASHSQLAYRQRTSSPRYAFTLQRGMAYTALEHAPEMIASVCDSDFIFACRATSLTVPLILSFIPKVNMSSL